MEVAMVDVGTSVRKLYSCLGERVTAGIRATGEMDRKEMQVVKLEGLDSLDTAGKGAVGVQDDVQLSSLLRNVQRWAGPRLAWRAHNLPL